MGTIVEANVGIGVGAVGMTVGFIVGGNVGALVVSTTCEKRTT